MKTKQHGLLTKAISSAIERIENTSPTGHKLYLIIRGVYKAGYHKGIKDQDWVKDKFDPAQGTLDLK